VSDRVGTDLRTRRAPIRRGVTERRDRRRNRRPRERLRALAAAAFTEPSQGVYEHFADGSLDDASRDARRAERLDDVVERPDRPSKTTETLAARYNDLFVVGYPR